MKSGLIISHLLLFNKIKHHKLLKWSNEPPNLPELLGSRPGNLPRNSSFPAQASGISHLAQLHNETTKLSFLLRDSSNGTLAHRGPRWPSPRLATVNPPTSFKTSGQRILSQARRPNKKQTSAMRTTLAPCLVGSITAVRLTSSNGTRLQICWTHTTPCW